MQAIYPCIAYPPRGYWPHQEWRAGNKSNKSTITTYRKLFLFLSLPFIQDREKQQHEGGENMKKQNHELNEI